MREKSNTRFQEKESKRHAERLLTEQGGRSRKCRRVYAMTFMMRLAVELADLPWPCLGHDLANLMVGHVGQASQHLFDYA